MAQDSFILVNLKESESKKLAQVISNDSSRKILDYLSEHKDGTATAIAKALGIPLSTAHYNLKALLKARLVQVDEFHYSEKGKEVDHYKLSNKFVVIAPSSAPEGLLQKLGKILPVGVLVVGASAIVHYVSRAFTGTFEAASYGAEKVAMDAVPEVARTLAAETVTKSMDAVATAGVDAVATAGVDAVAYEAMNVTTEAAPEVVTEVVTKYVTIQPNYALWFLIGGLFAILVWLIWDLVKRK